MVGNAAALGEWDPGNAVPMQWTDGHVWVTTVELDLPLSASDKPDLIQYKYVLMSNGQVSKWESCENRCLYQPSSGYSWVCENIWDDHNAVGVITPN